MGNKPKRDLLDQIRGSNQYIIACDVRDQAGKTRISYNKDVIEEGKKWYNEEYFEKGISFDDLPDEKKNNVSFLKGIEIATTSRERMLEAYDDGVQSRIDGVKFKELSEYNQNNKAFLQGYWDAKDQALIDGIDYPMSLSTEDIEMFKAGKAWFHDGFTIEDAPFEMKYNSYFIDGFMLEERKEQDRLKCYDSGMQKYVEGVPFKDNSREERQNKCFIRGYIDAHAQSLIDGIDWRNIPDDWSNDESFTVSDDIIDSQFKRRR